MAALSLPTLPAALSSRILRLLPVADRVRAGGVSPAWRAMAHAPALYGPELKLSDALDAPRTVADAAGRTHEQRRAAEELRCSALFVLRSLAALAAGTLTRLDVRLTLTPLDVIRMAGRRDTDSDMPDKLLAEAIVAIAAANPCLTHVMTDAPATLPACLQLLARSPRVMKLTVSRLAVTPAALCALSGDAAALAARLALSSLDLGRESQTVGGYGDEKVSFIGALTTARARELTASLRTTLAAVGAGAWHVQQLHLPGCKEDDTVLVSLLAVLTESAQAQDHVACGVEHLVLHYSYTEQQRPMSGAAGAALAAAANALPALRSITFSDERDPVQRGSHDYDDYADAGEVCMYLLQTLMADGMPLTPGGASLVGALAPRESQLQLLYGGAGASYGGFRQLLY
jgi:hypothetical protein